MKYFMDDVLYCLKLSLYFFAAFFALGLIIGLIIHGFNLREVLFWGCRVSEIAASFGLALSAISFTKKDLMRPLNYQKQWEMYFTKLNLAHAIFFVSLFTLIFAFIVDYFARPI